MDYFAALELENLARHFPGISNNPLMVENIRSARKSLCEALTIPYRKEDEVQ